MTELDLYKFCADKEMDWRRGKLVVWFYHFHLQDFMEMVGDRYLSDNYLDASLQANGMVAVEISELCEHFDIDPERIHPKE